jgi:hypothetical protein
MAGVEAPSLLRRLSWEEVADGRLWRLKAGKHFPRGSALALRREALAAAEQLERPVMVVRDNIGKWDYVWVQFADGELPIGSPCPHCAGGDVSRIHENFARCRTCRATLLLRAPREPVAAAAVHPIRDLARYTDLRLQHIKSAPGLERFVGYGLSWEGKPTLLEVTFTVDEEGRRVPDPLRPGEWLYRIRTLPAVPFLDALDVDAFDGIDVEAYFDQDDRA